MHHRVCPHWVCRRKKAYLLYSHERRKIFESCDVKFEEIEGREHITVDSDSDDEGVLDAPNTRNGDPEGEHTVDAPSTPMEEVDHQEVQKTTPDTHTHSSGTQPTPLHHSTCCKRRSVSSRYKNPMLSRY